MITWQEGMWTKGQAARASRRCLVKVETSDWESEVEDSHKGTQEVDPLKQQWNCLTGNGIDRNCSWKGSSSMGRPPEVALTDKVASWAQQPVKVGKTVESLQ